MKTVLLMFALLGLSACTVIGPGERGVRYNFGSVSEEVMSPGTHLWIPYLAGAKTIDVKIRELKVQTSSGTKDQQEATMLVTVNVRINPDKVVDIVKNSGSDEALYETITPLIAEAVNASTAKYSAKELLTLRQQLKEDIDKIVDERISKYGADVVDVFLTDTQYSKNYTDAIESAQVEEMKSKEAEYRTRTVEQNAKSAVAQAKGEADAALISAKSEAEANKLKQQTLTEQLIKYEMIQKWDGKLPQVQSGSGSGLMLNFNPSSK